jgi:hypothetical protein
MTIVLRRRTNALERTKYWLGDRLSAAPKMLGKSDGVGKVTLAKLRQRAFGEQRRRQSQQGSRLLLARFHCRHTPDIDRCHYAEGRQSRN